MSAFGYSYLRINPAHVLATAWADISDGSERELPVQFETWEHSVDLHLMRRMRIDMAGVAADLALDLDTLVLDLVVNVGYGGPRGDRRREIWWRRAITQADCEASPEFILSGADLSEAVSLRTALLLRAPVQAGSDLSPKMLGQRLWEDWRLSILEPVNARFRIEPASFTTAFPDTPAVLWRLDWSPEDPARDFGGTIRLLINSDNSAFIQAFSANDDLATRLVMTGVISQITRGVLANPAFTPGEDQPTSVGAAVSSWLDRAFPGQGVQTVQEMMSRDPARFEAALAGLVDA